VRKRGIEVVAKTKTKFHWKSKTTSTMNRVGVNETVTSIMTLRHDLCRHLYPYDVDTICSPKSDANAENRRP
jgi:hypothetical protein